MFGFGLVSQAFHGLDLFWKLFIEVVDGITFLLGDVIWAFRFLCIRELVKYVFEKRFVFVCDTVVIRLIIVQLFENVLTVLLLVIQINHLKVLDIIEFQNITLTIYFNRHFNFLALLRCKSISIKRSAAKLVELLQVLALSHHAHIGRIDIMLHP